MARNRMTPEQEDELHASEWRAHKERLDCLWNVPERARDAYLDMEDDFKPETVLEFMKAMLPEEDV